MLGSGRRRALRRRMKGGFLPAPTITTVSENVPALTDHGTLPLRSSISGVQRVTITDARRRTCPYVHKALGIVAPKVLSSRTF